MKVIWSGEALANLEEIGEYIGQDKPGAARRFLRRIRSRKTQISQMPYSGRKVPERDDENLREVIEAPYRIVYRVRPDQECVVIELVYHSSRLFPTEE